MPSLIAENRPAQRARLTAAIATGLIGLAFASSIYWGVSFWVASTVLILALTFGLSQFVSSKAALAFSISFVLLLCLFVLRISPYLGRHIVLFTAGALAVAAVIAAVLAYAAPIKYRLFAHRSLPEFIAVAVAPFIGVISSVVIWLKPGADSLGWAMLGDAVPDMMFSRFMAYDGGVNTALHPHSSPLPYGLIALQISPRRPDVPASEMLRHDLEGQAQLWALLTILASLLMSLVVARMLRDVRGALKIAAVIIAGMLPYTWFVIGFSSSYGFFNVAVLVVLLLLSWLLWLELSEHPVVSIVGLMTVSTLLLATWAPIVVVPLVLALVGFVSQRALVRNWLRSAITVFVFALAGAQFVLYVVLVSLPDVLRDAGRLAFDGAIPFSMPASAFFLAGLGGVAALVSFRLPRGRWDAVGLSSVVTASIPAMLYLIYQRKNLPTVWGYYPQKFAWVLAILLLVIFVAVGVRFVSTLTGRWYSKVGPVAAICSVLMGVMLLNPPQGNGLTLLTPLHAIYNGHAVMTTSMVKDTFELSGKRGAVVWDYRGQTADLAIDSWLIQMRAKSEGDPTRYWSYYLTSTNALCQVAIDSSVPITVYTSNKALANAGQFACSDRNLTVVYRKPVA